MWGANKWTDSMIKKYWWYIVLFIIIYLFVKIFN